MNKVDIAPSHRDFEKGLKRKYPLLYRDMWGDARNTCMAYGINVDKGWFPIIEDLSAKLEPKIRKIKEEVERNPSMKCENCGRGKRWHWLFFVVFSVACLFKNLKLWPKVAWREFKRNRGWLKMDRKMAKMGKLPGGKKSIYSGFGLFRGVFRFPSLHKACRTFRVSHPCAAQVKEKFSGLRFYMTNYNEEIEKLISEAEELSYRTCEHCGVPGKQRSGGWIKTLCDDCDTKRRYK